MEGLGKINLRSKTGSLVPLSAFATVSRTVGPTAVNHQGQLQAITIAFNLAPDMPLGNATQMTDEERAVIAAWVKSGAKPE